MNIIKFLCGVKWGSDPSTLLILYKSYVRSLIDYGSFIYFPKSQQHVETLEKIQFANLRALMGYRISTPTNVIIAESKIQSILELERTAALCKSYQIKILSNSNLAISDTVRKTNSFLMRNQSNLNQRILNLCIREIYQLEIDTQSNYNIYCFHYKTSVTSIDINTELGSKMKEAPDPNRLLHNYLEKLEAHPLFTDGSKNSNHFVGSACIYPDENRNSGRSISKTASIYTAE